jgi:hypothetical protein
MKRVIPAVVALLLVAGSSFAQAPDSTYVGLFTDVDHTVWTQSYTGATTLFYMYIFWLPTEKGMQAAEFSISYPDNIVGLTVTKDADITVTLGDLEGGISIATGTCHPGGVWYQTHRQRLALYDAEVSTVRILANPTLIPPKLQIASCELGYQKYPVRKFTNLCINEDCSTATTPKTWGAIKSLF